MSDKRDGKGRKNSMNKGEESWSFQDLQDHLPTAAYTSSSSGPSSKTGQSSGKKPVGDHEGVESYTTIMGFCIEDKLGVICADSRMNHDGNVLRDEAKKIGKFTDNIAIAGSGSQPIFDEVKVRLKDLKLMDLMVVTVEDAVQFIVKLTQRCVQENMEIKPADGHVVDYIVIGKLANKLEMYRIHNAHDNMHLTYVKASTRFMNAGSGKSALEAYQTKNKSRDWCPEYLALKYCFECMKDALAVDKANSGSIIMYSINIDDDEGLKLHGFPVSDVYGYMLETHEKKSRLLAQD